MRWLATVCTGIVVVREQQNISFGYGAADIARNHQTNNLVNDLASYFTVAAAQGAPDLASANSNFQAMANQLGYNKDKKNEKPVRRTNRRINAPRS